MRLVPRGFCRAEVSLAFVKVRGCWMLFLLENPSLAPHLALLWRRAVAQLGSALEWGSRGRGFESRRPDHVSANMLNISHLRKRRCARIRNGAGNNSPEWLVTRP